MYRLIQFARHNLPFIWALIETINAACFRLRYGKKLNKLSDLCKHEQSSGLSYHIVTDSDVEALADFFRRQPDDAYEFFHPHEFKKKALEKLIKNPSFIMFISKDANQIVGYAFMRCFMNGKAFRGKIVDINYRGKGIAKTFGNLMTKSADALGIGLFGTISKVNVASMASSKAVNEIRIIEELPNDYLLIQYLPKKDNQ